MAATPETEWRQDRLRLTLPNDLVHVGVARAFVRAAAQRYGYSVEDLDNWETVIEEAVNNVVRYGYDPGETASFDIDCLLGTPGLTVRIRDRGRPFNPKHLIGLGGDPKAVHQRGLGWHLMQKLMDVATLESLGREGKQLTLYKAAPHQLEPRELANRPAVAAPALAAGQEIVCRQATADDADEVIRLFYDCYRYSYFNEQVYSPEALGEMIVKGEIDSFVAELPDGRVAAHLALVHSRDRPKAIEYGMAATDPACRGRGIFEKMMQFVADPAARSGKNVRFGGAVTAHVASQKAFYRLGFNECGLMLGAVPAENFSGLEAKDQGRGTILFLSDLQTTRPAPTLFIPPQHHDFISGLYGRSRIPFQAGEAAPVAHESTDITVSVRPKIGVVRATVQCIGADLGDRIKIMMHAARLGRVEVGQLFLPLTDPALPDAVTLLEGMGWFVTGMMPEGGAAGDVLLMHWLNGWAMDYDAIAMGRDEGRRLVEDIRARDPEWR
jgi:serine/threonine-protein kinase RsbW